MTVPKIVVTGYLEMTPCRQEDKHKLCASVEQDCQGTTTDANGWGCVFDPERQRTGEEDEKL